MRCAALVAIALVGCAHGNPKDVDVDASVDAPVVITGPDCGGRPCDAIEAIHVAPTGDDAAPGTRDAPMKTIAAAITRAAAASPVEAVFVQAGSYAESIAMHDGVTIFGGFDTAWLRGDAATTEITAASPAVTFDAITTTTALDRVTVKSADAAGAGASSIAVLVTGSAMVALRNVTLLPGAGAPGSDGSDGGAGGVGFAGGIGGKGVEHSTFLGCNNDRLPVGGAAGGSQCARTGGAGGGPGVGDGGGGMGGPGIGGTLGGPGGASTKAGTAGAAGAGGSGGVSGAGAPDSGSFAGPIYRPADGGNGTAGGNANGGGGGGGGGGGTTLCDSSGSSDGGGGGGGCGGGAGTGGGEPQAHEDLAHALGAREREPVVVARAAHGVGVPDHRDVGQRPALELREDALQLALRAGRELVAALEEIERESRGLAGERRERLAEARLHFRGRDRIGAEAFLVDALRAVGGIHDLGFSRAMDDDGAHVAVGLRRDHGEELRSARLVPDMGARGGEQRRRRESGEPQGTP